MRSRIRPRPRCRLGGGCGRSPPWPPEEDRQPRGKRRSEQVEAMAARVLAHVKANADHRLEQIGQGLRIATKDLELLVAEAPRREQAQDQGTEARDELLRVWGARSRFVLCLTPLRLCTAVGSDRCNVTHARRKAGPLILSNSVGSSPDRDRGRGAWNHALVFRPSTAALVRTRSSSLSRSQRRPRIPAPCADSLVARAARVERFGRRPADPYL
jgi:hypothetical protein